MARHEIIHPDSLRQLQAHVARLEQEVYNTRRRLGAFRCELDDVNGPLRGGCLDENHPGRSTVFNINLGTWDSSANGWDYDLVNTVKAIDHRYDVPYPDAGATGLFEMRASDTYGVIYEVVALDCSSAGACP